MCGIAGYLNIPEFDTNSSKHARRMLGAIQHRGLDDLSYCAFEGTMLASARLSIIDIDNGQQPMMSPDERYVIVYNGELFNYIELRHELEEAGLGQFSTKSDTEVVLNAIITWGIEKALPKFNGQFAFCFLDTNTGEAFFGRDSFGERPLFFTLVEQGLVFASEIKSLFAIPSTRRQLCQDGLRQIAHLWSTIGQSTVFEGVYSLPVSHFAKWDGKLSMYAFTPCQITRVDPDASFEEQVRETLDRAVRRRLRSDVDVGVLVSGGLDSAITATIARTHQTSKMNSFSIEFDQQDFDESKYQKLVVESLGTDHQHLHVTASDISEAFCDVVWHAETPLFRTAPIPMYLLAKKIHQSNLKVVLSGEGADEIFLGYDIFKEAKLIEGFHKFVNDHDRIEYMKQIYPYLSHFSNARAASMLHFYRACAADSGTPLISHRSRFMNGAYAARVFGRDVDDKVATESLLTYLNKNDSNFENWSLIDRAQQIEKDTILSGYLLCTQGDRMTSAWNVEGRAPFLDPEVVSLAKNISNEMLLQGHNEKAILKSAYRGKIPQPILERAKQPYRAPGMTCLRPNSADWISDILSPESIRSSDVVNVDFATNLISSATSLPEERISPRIDQSYMLLLSTLILERSMVKEFHLPDPQVPVREVIRRL